jgi:phospholipid/cholesterol/gamma-HCH transport system ATP-binding protein
MDQKADVGHGNTFVPEERPVTLEEALGGPGAPVVVFDHVSLAFDEAVVLKDVSFTLITGHTKVVLGASGAGKSTILKIIIGLLRPDAGVVWVNGERVDELSEDELMVVRAHVGMVFQEGALFDSLTVAENVGFKLYEETDLPLADVRKRVEEVLGFVGLEDYIDRMPSELSGGQRRRVAIARAMAAKPRLLLYDEPTTGLDPITATTVDDEIIKLRDLEGVSSILVTHQLRDAFYIATHQAVRDNGAIRIIEADRVKAEEAEFMMLRNGLIVFEGTAAELRGSGDGYLRTFLS